MVESCKSHGFYKRNFTKCYPENLNCRNLFRDLILNENVLRRLILV